MQIDWFTFFAQVFNFLILIWLLKKFLFGPVMNVMKKREEKVESRLEEAKSRLEEAEKKADVYQSRVDEFEDQKDELMKEARRKAEAHKKELIEDARREAEKLSERWNESIKMEKESFLDELEKKAFQQIMDVVEKIIADLADSSLEEKSLDTFLKKLNTMSSEDKKTLSRAAEDGQMDILTAFELTEPDKKKMTGVIRDLVSGETHCRFKTDDSLGFGLELRTNGWKLGWSMRSYLDDLLAELEGYLDREAGSAENENEQEEKEEQVT